MVAPLGRFRLTAACGRGEAHGLVPTVVPCEVAVVLPAVADAASEPTDAVNAAEADDAFSTRTVNVRNASSLLVTLVAQVPAYIGVG